MAGRKKGRTIKSGSGKTLEPDFRRIVQTIRHYGIVALDGDGQVTNWNPGAEQITGFSSQEAVGRSFSSFWVEGADRESGFRQQLKQAAAAGLAEFEGWRLRKDGTRVRTSEIIAPMPAEKGTPGGFALVMRDICERKEREERLRASEEQFRRLVEGVEGYAIYMLDPMGNVATWNAGAERIKQYRASEIIGKNFICFYTAGDVAAGKPQQNLAEARRRGSVRDQGLRVRKDGTTFFAEVTMSALRDGSGQITGFSKVTRDVTDQIRTRRMEAAKIAAEQANQAKDDFLAALSHELRAPLTPALAAASYLYENASKIPAEFAEDLEAIQRNVQLQARLIDDLLDLTRVTRGKIELQFKCVDAHAVLREALDMTQANISGKALKVSMELKAREHHIWADPVRIQQVFWNLLNNAVKFTGPGGGIAIRTSNDDHEHFIFEVADTGIGIETQRQALIFQPFEQGDRSITRQFGGLGLGLAISKSLIDLHHGAITVESRGRSHGATFRVVLDVVKERVGRSGIASHAPDEPARVLRILLIEDHDDTRRVLARLLRHFGHEIAVADSSQSAFAMINARDFDVILSDIGLPDGSGYDIIAEVKRTRPVKGVALTGFGTDDDIRRSKEAGFDFHLIKPVDVHELRSILSQVGG
jgi:PAS domain S-box-containing protein